MNVAFGLSLLVASPAAAQLEFEFPQTPPAEGQTLLEWANPPVLTYTIPEDRRDDVSSCGSDFEHDLLKVAATCWPVLQALKLYTLADYASGEPSGDKLANQREAIRHADAMLELVGEAEWPLEEFLRGKALERKLTAYERFGDWEAALKTSDELLATLRSDLMPYDDFARGFAHRRRGEALIELGRSDEARADLEEAMLLFDGPFRDMVGWPLSNHSENVIKDALRKGDFDYAQRTIDRYLEFVRQEPRGQQFGIIDHLNLKLYLAAAKGDLPSLRTALNERIENDNSGWGNCPPADRLFPAVLAPVRTNEEIMAMLKAYGCGEQALANMEAAAKNGIRDSEGKLILPYVEPASD